MLKTIRAMFLSPLEIEPDIGYLWGGSDSDELLFGLPLLVCVMFSFRSWNMCFNILFKYYFDVSW